MADKKINLETDYLAGKVIPFLLPLSVDSGLNVQQVFASSDVIFYHFVKKTTFLSKRQFSQLFPKLGLRFFNYFFSSRIN